MWSLRRPFIMTSPYGFKVGALSVAPPNDPQRSESPAAKLDAQNIQVTAWPAKQIGSTGARQEWSGAKCLCFL
jgi:hypothetical protein